MKKKRTPLPPAGSSMALATYRLEKIACAIHKTVQKKKSAAVDKGQLRDPLEAYAHFRRKAFKLLAHYVDNDFEAAFRWLLEMHGAAPRRSRGSVRGNEFHLGLLAMTAAAGQFMHPNKLRDLAALMQQAHSEEVAAAQLDEFVARARKIARASRMVDDSKLQSRRSGVPSPVITATRTARNCS